MDKGIEMRYVQKNLFVDWSKPILDVLRPIKKKEKK